jgi:hypothetical protein
MAQVFSVDALECEARYPWILSPALLVGAGRRIDLGIIVD